MLPSEDFVFIEKVRISRSLLKSIFQSWWESIYNNELLKFETLFFCPDFLRFYSRIRRIEWKRNSLGRALLSYCFRHPLCYEKQIRETFGRRCEAATRILKISVFHFFVVYLWRFSLWAFDIKISSAKKARSSSNDECINECIIHNAFKMNFLHAIYVLFITEKAFPLFFSVEASLKKI